MLDNTPQNLKRWIQDAQSIKVGAKMPTFSGLSDADAEQIATYLQSLR
jgi:cytochrome c oxidase subunit 2